MKYKTMPWFTESNQVILPSNLHIIYKLRREYEPVGFEFTIYKDKDYIDKSRIDYLLMKINNYKKQQEYEDLNFTAYKIEVYIESMQSDSKDCYKIKIFQRSFEPSFEYFDRSVPVTFHRGNNCNTDLFHTIPNEIMKYVINLSQHLQSKYYFSG